MDGKWFMRLVALVLALLVIVGIGYGAYNLGVAQGVVAKASPAAGQGATTPVPYYGWPLIGAPFWGFHLLGLIFGIFVVFAVIRLISFAIWGPRWGHWRRMHAGWDEELDVPTKFREWHDRAHKPSQNSPQS